MKNRIKVIRIIAFIILMLIFMEKVSNVIAECVDAMKIRNILNEVLYIVSFLLFVILIKNKKMESPQVTIPDFFLLGTFVTVLITTMASVRNDAIQYETNIVNAFPGNNGYDGYYVNGAKGYCNIEAALENSIKDRKRLSKLKEIHRAQVGENLCVYFKEDGKNIVEFAFLKQNDLYYITGGTGAFLLLGDKYTPEETVKEDMVHTMARGDYDKLIAPAGGISVDERIFSMTINGKKVDEVVPIYEKDGKECYFWISTNVEEIKTIDDVKSAKIEMNSLQ